MTLKWEAPLLIVPCQRQWDEWFDAPPNDECSGLKGGCDYCLKEMYQKRSVYLTSYVGIFLKNRPELREKKLRMPLLVWYSMPTAKLHNLSTFHQSHCDWSPLVLQALETVSPALPRDIITLIVLYLRTTVSKCPCDAALFLNACYDGFGGHVEEVLIWSMDQIWPRYRKLLKIANKERTF